MAKRKEDKMMANNDLQNTTQKTKDWATRKQLQNRGRTRVPRMGMQFPLFLRTELASFKL